MLGTRPVVHCRNKACPLHTRPQFEPKNGKCRKCLTSFVASTAVNLERLPEPQFALRAHGINPFGTCGFAVTFFLARTMAGMSQGDLAKRIGTFRPHISRWECSSVPTISAFERIAAGLGMTTYKLALIYDFLTSPIGPIHDPDGAASQGAVNV